VPKQHRVPTTVPARRWDLHPLDASEKSDGKGMMCDTSRNTHDFTNRCLGSSLALFDYHHHLRFLGEKPLQGFSIVANQVA